jgi:hypothetical protein
MMVAIPIPVKASEPDALAVGMVKDESLTCPGVPGLLGFPEVGGVVGLSSPGFSGGSVRPIPSV